MITDLKYWSSSKLESNDDNGNDIRRIISLSREEVMNVHDEDC